MTSIPAELRSRRQWVLWRLESRNGKATKVPYSTSGNLASSTDSSTWTSYDSVAEAFAQHPDEFSGIGFVFAKGDNLFGVDLDRAVENGKLAAWAKAIVRALDTYSETSPSGTGIHAIGAGTVSGGKGRKNGRIEIYSEGRYFTVTGKHIAGTPTSVNPRQEALDKLYRETFGEKKNGSESGTEKQSHAETISDEDLIAIAGNAANGEKFKALWQGKWEGAYESQSNADLALCSILAFYVGPHGHEQVRRLFRKSKLGNREKAEREDYLERTVAAAFENMDSFYQSGGSSPRAEESTARKPYRFMSLADMASLPRPRWQVTGYVPERSLVLVYGPAGTKKSFLAADMALSVASGFPWLEHAVRPGFVCYTAGEGAHGFINRILAWGRNALTTCMDGFMFGPVPQLLDPGSVGGFVEAAMALPRKPALIFLDTFARAFVGGDENSAGDVGKAVGSLDLIRKETGAAVVVIHHAGKDTTRGARGSTALAAAADVVLSVDEEKDGTISVATDKMKDAEERKPFFVYSEVIPLGLDLDGEPVSSLRLRRRTLEEAVAARGKAAADIFALLSKPAFTDGLMAGEIRSRLGDMPKSTFFDAVDGLVETGIVKKTGERYRVTKGGESGGPVESGEQNRTPGPSRSVRSGGGLYRDPPDSRTGAPNEGEEKPPIRPVSGEPAWLSEDPPAAPRDPKDNSLREPGEEDPE